MCMYVRMFVFMYECFILYSERHNYQKPKYTFTKCNSQSTKTMTKYSSHLHETNNSVQAVNT